MSFSFIKWCIYYCHFNQEVTEENEADEEQRIHRHQGKSLQQAGLLCLRKNCLLTVSYTA